MRNHFPLRLALAASFALIGSDALAIDNGACCVQSTSRLETLLNPTKGSDEQFFTSAGGPPNVMFILDTSCSMKGWPADWPSSKGCSSTTFAGAGYDPATNYRGFISGMSGTTGAKLPTFDPKWFSNDIIYQANGDSGFSTSAFGHNFSSGGGPTGTKWDSGSYNASRDAACNTITGGVATDITTCKACLDSAGYYVQDSDTRIASGNFLKYYSPKDVSAVMVLSHLLFDIREVRLGIMTFDNWGGSSCLAAGNSDGPTCLWQPMAPNCDKIYPFDTSAVENNRNSILNALSANNSFNSHTPLATDLYMAGWHLRASATSPDGYDNLFAGSYPGNGTSCSGCNFNNLNEPNTANARSICTGCSFNAAIILTDGEPRDELITTWPAEITSLTSATATTCPAGTGECNSYLDEIAAFLYRNDLRPELPGKQNVATYTIGFGTSPNANQLLNSTAKVGGGKFYPALGAAAINDAILSIFDDIASRNNSFSSSAVAAVQTGSSSTPALLPRMMPKAGQPWEGKLWRFEQYNEFAESGNPDGGSSDLNADGDLDDVFIVDSATPTAANIVTESADGTFVRAGTSTPATAFWEANAKLVTDLAANVDNRKVWTVLDTNSDGAFTNADTLTRFQPTNDAADLRMAEYMGLVGSSFCPNATSVGSLLTKWGMSVSQAQSATSTTVLVTEADYARLCARLVMKWVEGADYYDADGDGVRTEVRPNVLGDIFHSAPVLVEAPVDTYLCELGLSNQCVRTLYSQNLKTAPTPLASETTTLVGSGACTNAAKPSYDAWVWDQRRRDKVVLVGANDGMVHAFLSGRYNGTEPCVGGVPTPEFDRGTGQELWAFIPPDLLPKLPDLILSHEYMIDGDIMVRDIWADNAALGTKEKSEFHTMAVISEGRGGKHYFALEITYAANGLADDRPGFRWMFPQPCSEEAALFGKTLFSLSPKPPPIGPMLINNSSLPTPIGGAITRYTVPTHERWMVAVSGGWSPGQERGRGIYLLDAWNGSVNGRRDNLWWKFEYDESPPSGGNEAPKKELTNSVAAPIALVDYGPDDAPDQDGFFDTAIFSDTAGQIWVARMQTPGVVSTASSINRINNWWAGRAFEMDRDGVPGAAAGTPLEDGGVEPVDLNAKSVANKWPFFYLPSVAIEPGTNRMRVFAGTGNRYAILETGPGMCRFDNPLACAKAHCDEFNVHHKYKDDVVNLDSFHTHWKDRRFEHGKLGESLLIDPTTLLLTPVQMCGVAGNKQVEAENSEFKVGTCNMTTGTDPNPGKVNEIKYECGLNTSGSSFTCTRKSIDRNLNDLVDPSAIDVAGLGNNRFVGFWAYGGRQPDAGYRGFGGTTGVSPQDYDSARVSDRSTAFPGRGELYDITNVGCTAASCDGGAPEDGYGWFYTYNALSTKTATGAAIIASCVLWNDLSPTGGDGGLCGSSITPSASMYQADFLTGQPNCAQGFLPSDGGAYARYQTRTVVSPPPEPRDVVQINRAGEVRYSAQIASGASTTSVNVSGNQDVLQLVYELPVSRSLHNCRHTDAGCFTTP